MNDKHDINIGCNWSFLPALAILFIALKLAHQIDWNWFVVLSPLWLPFALVIGGLLCVCAFVLLALVFVAIAEACGL